MLASGSPRRKELLANLIHDFEVHVPNVEEGLLENETLIEATQRLALKKARALRSQFPTSLLIAADTLVGFEDGDQLTVLGKPQTEGGAREMLLKLSGRSHFVVTGVAIVVGAEERVFAETTEVRFRKLSLEEIDRYVATREPLDKAGAYGIQGRAAGFVERMQGSLSNVVGLPLELLETELEGLMLGQGHGFRQE